MTYKQVSNLLETTVKDLAQRQLAVTAQMVLLVGPEAAARVLRDLANTVERHGKEGR